LLKFFNAKRVYSIHRGVVSPEKLTIPITDVRMNGVLQPGPQSISFYKFDGTEEFWQGGSNNAFRLCDEYRVALTALVSEWVAKRAELGIA
jgi:hypothetical protein